MKIKISISLLFLIAILSCEQEVKEANAIVNETIKISGGALFNKSDIEFDFRNKHYKASRNNGKFIYERVFNDSLGVINDVLTNKGFQRFVNDSVFEVSDEKAKAYSSSVNSVHYFSVLPYGLNDKAVNKSYLGKIEIKNLNYFKIKVTFNKEGGGEDFDDEFVYWINTKTFKVDYLAYSYNENDGKGYRFREVYNECYINGIRFVDYNNYKSKNEIVTLSNLDELFKLNQLELLSKIELKNIYVLIKTIQ